MKFQLFIDHNNIKHQVLKKIEHSSIKLIINQKNKLKAEKDLTSDENDHQYMIITTSLLFETRVLSYINQFNIRKHWNFYSDVDILAHLKWNLIIQDEFHEKKNQSSTIIRLFQKLTCQQEEFFLSTWLLSEMMFEKNSIDLQHWINVLETDIWTKHSVLKHIIKKSYKILFTWVQQFLNKLSSLL